MTESVLGKSRDWWRATAFLGGLALVIVGSAASAAFGGFDVVVRLVGYALAVYGPLSYVRSRFSW